MRLIKSLGQAFLFIIVICLSSFFASVVLFGFGMLFRIDPSIWFFISISFGLLVGLVAIVVGVVRMVRNKTWTMKKIFLILSLLLFAFGIGISIKHFNTPIFSSYSVHYSCTGTIDDTAFCGYNIRLYPDGKVVRGIRGEEEWKMSSDALKDVKEKSSEILDKDCSPPKAIHCDDCYDYAKFRLKVQSRELNRNTVSVECKNDIEEIMNLIHSTKN